MLGLPFQGLIRALVLSEDFFWFFTCFALLKVLGANVGPSLVCTGPPPPPSLPEQFEDPESRIV